MNRPEKINYVEFPGEADLPEVWPEPVPIIVETLQTYKNVNDNLPDVALNNMGS